MSIALATPLRWFVAPAFIALLAACGTGPAPDASANDAASDTETAPAPRWPCPEGWVDHSRGGCGPAVVLCAPDGGAAPDACDPRALAPSRPVDDPDDPEGGPGATFALRPDGAITGAWREPGEPDGPPAPDWTPAGPDAPPAADWAPTTGVTRCPAAWSPQPDRTCDPRVLAACPAHSGPLPGGRCTATGADTCPAGDYPDPGPKALGAPHLHVRAGASPAGADGSVARPYPTIEAGIAAAASVDGWVLVAAGTYRESFAVDRGTTRVIGACPARVRVEAAVARASIFTAYNPGTTLIVRGVTLAGGGVAAHTSGRALVRGVHVTDPFGFALRASEGGQVRAEDTWVSGVRRGLLPPEAAVRVEPMGRVECTRVAITDVDANGVLAFGAGAQAALTDVAIARAEDRGVLAAVGAAVDGARVVVEGARLNGVGAESTASRATFEDVVVRGTRPALGGRGGEGLHASLGGELTVRNALIDGNRETGAFTSDPGSRLVLSDAVVRGTLPIAGAPGVEGRGLRAAGGARLTADRVRVEANTDSGIAVFSPGTRATLTDVDVIATRPRPSDGGGGSGLVAADDAVITATGLRVAGNRQTGVQLDRGASGTFTRLLVRDTAANLLTGEGAAFTLSARARASVRAARIDSNLRTGVLVVGEGADLGLSDAVVRDTRAGPDGTGGRGLGVQRGAHAVVTRVAFDANHEVGAYASGSGTDVTVADSVVRATGPRGDGEAGHGLHAQEGAALRAVRTLVQGNHGGGLVASGAGTTVRLTECAVRDTRASRRPSGLAFGVDAVAQFGASVGIVRSVLAGAHDAEVYAGNAGTALLLRDSAVRSGADAALAATLQVVDGAAARIRRVVLDGARNAALIANGAAPLEVHDLIALGTRPGGLSLGAGIEVTDGEARLSSVSVVGAFGVGVGALPLAVQDGVAVGAGRVRATDVFVRRLEPGTLVPTVVSDGGAPPANRRAYGVYAGESCELDLARAVIDEGGFGFFNARGTLALREAVILRQIDFPGVVAGSLDPPALVLEDVTCVHPSGACVRPQDDLPRAAALRPPTSPCTQAACLRTQ